MTREILQMDVVKALAASGLSYREIADRTNVSHTAVAKFCQRHGIPSARARSLAINVTQVRALANRNMTLNEMCPILKCSPQSLYNLCKRHGIVYKGMRTRRVQRPGTGINPAYLVLPPALTGDPIRASMYALAEFDPVIARALRERIRAMRAKMGEDTEPSPE